MKVITPVEITEDKFLSSSIPEPDPSQGEVEWSSNLNSARYSTKEKSTAIASSGSVDYVVSFTGSATMTEYVGGVQSYEKPLVEIEYLPSDAHYYDGFVYIADLITIKYYNVSTKAEGEVIVSGGIEAGTVFTSITSVGDSFYLYDRVNQKVKVYTLLGNVLTYSKEFPVSIEGGYPKLTTANGGGFFVLTLGEVFTYSDAFNLISEKKVPMLSYQAEAYGGLANTGSEIVAIGSTADSAEVYSYEFEYNGLYEIGDRVIKVSTHKEYQALSKTEQDPEVGATGDSTATWIEVKPTNKWSIFDSEISSPSISSGNLNIQIKPESSVDSVATFGLFNVDSVDVIATSDVYGEMYNQNHDTIGLDELVIMDIPPFDDYTISITFNGSDLSVGDAVAGLSADLGLLLEGAQVDTKDFSSQKENDFGYLEVIKRPIINQTTYPLIVEKQNAASTKRLLDNLRATQAVWVGDTGGGVSIVTYGFVERSPMVYSNQDYISYQVKVRGTI